MGLAGLVPGCPQFLLGEALLCSDYPPLSLQGKEKGWSKGCANCTLWPFPLPPMSPTCSPFNWCVLGKGAEGKMAFTATTAPPSKAQCSSGPSTRQKAWGTSLPWMEALGCRQADSPSTQDTQILLFCLHTTGQDTHPHIYWTASTWTRQPCATQKPRTTWEKLYLKQNYLIVCTIKTQISAWLQHE